MSQTVSVEVGEDHLAAFMRSPRIAIAELVWNALDADATEVDVTFQLNGFDGIDGVLVSDNGHGMSPVDASYGFGNFGNSWKRTATGTPSGRALHGKLGRGRYTAYSIGAHALWTTVADDNGARKRLTISGSASNLRDVSISDALETRDPTGTVVTISDLSEKTSRELARDGVWEELTTRFALYLEQYPTVIITYRSNPLKPDGLRTRTETWPVVVDGGAAELQLIEWDASKVKVDRKLYLCDEHGSALADIPPGVQAPGYQFTAYLRWAGFQEIGHDIVMAEMDKGEVGDLIAAAKDRIRDYFKERANERQQEVIKEWEDNGIYPYKEKPQSATQVIERQAFDIVALSAASIVNEGTTRSRKFTLSLIKAALEAGPTALQDVLLNVLELPTERVNDLKVLLDRTTLSSIIEVSKRVADRLDFLRGLWTMIFDDQSKKQTLERRQLHRILANETWIFGEEWALTGDDDRLSRVLASYLHFLGRDDEIELLTAAPIFLPDGRVGIPDLVLSRTLKTSENKYQHLVIELKRPSHVLNMDDLTQIHKYAVAIARDDRFLQPNAHWDYVLVGNEADELVEGARSNLNQPYGQYQIQPKFTIWVRTWAEIIGDAEHRHKFVQESLNYTSSHDQGVEHLRERHNQYLPGTMKE